MSRSLCVHQSINSDNNDLLKLNGSEIKRVTKTKSLGVIIDQGLDWEDQFKAIKAKVRGGLASLKTLKYIVSQSQLRNVYRALVARRVHSYGRL